jgi:hypothetical protein
LIQWYRQTIEETGRSGVLWLLIAFVITFAATRTITRLIRTSSSKQRMPGEKPGLIKDIHIGGVHVHHQVWGILMVLLAGLLEFAYTPGTPWLEILAAVFGVGAALTLDEFALWVHLDDVYWSKEGRKSVDAVIVAATLCAVLLLGTAPFGVDESTRQDGLGALAVWIAINLVLSVIALLKGKLATGLIGVFAPFVSLVGAIRLAKPGSPWARWRYAKRPRKLARAEGRFGERYQLRWDRIRDAIGGFAPVLASAGPGAADEGHDALDADATVGKRGRPPGP